MDVRLPAKVVREVIAQAVACCRLANDNALAPFSRSEKCKNNLTTSNLRDRRHHARVCALRSFKPSLPRRADAVLSRLSRWWGPPASRNP
jgi:hypothetical protein